ncbi:semaphorin-3D-like [Rhineura floridana]|uniref:semaphorin-3D-like n=1 Tax=Rhineura floridana TaxID=261503 RepID=UPI002AC85C4B|nr:semaphorin-3D-like [Rhineura floridana]XP_061473889.1 semaphorin-3D-like [Rhineura floridana]XP_061473890.1 semaphorin-3D-like [Rhineura floridana]XP_061473891.1 semaphorin-3D-like [Rhineura floridana]XP_061473892.1 semaphorin-3D-like [Rhineura floridana]
MISLTFCRCCCFTTNIALVAWVILLTVENGTPWKQQIPRLRLSYQELLRSNSSHLLLDSEDELAFQSLLLDEKRAWLMAGAKDLIFLLNLNSPSKKSQKIFWPAPREQMEHCRLAGKNPETECANFIRFLQHFNSTHVFACGTGSYQPMCAFIHLRTGLEESEMPAMELVTYSIESGRGKCPYSPHEPFTGLLIDREFYSGTSIDFMGSSAAFFRTRLDRADQNYIRTEQNQDYWLNEPVFIGAYAISDTYNHDDDKVYFFFRETAVEAGQWERRRIHARVARVCKNDVGGKHSLINRWSTFLKARLVCSIPGLQGTETHFDQLEDVFLLHARNGQNPLVYGLFTVSSGIFTGSAVCVYSLAAIRAAFNGPFAHKEGLDYQWVEYRGRIPYPRPGTCPSETYDPLLQSTKDFPDEVIGFMRTHHLMWNPIYPLHWKPVLMRVNVPFQIQHMLVDRVDIEAGPIDVLFLGTDEGKVLKVGIAGIGGEDPHEISLEVLTVSKMSSAILDMQFSLKRQEVFVSSTSSLVQLSLYRCELYGKACAECCLARDPYCTWDGKSCRPYLLTKKRRAQCQNVLKANPISQCQDTAKGTSTAEEKVVFGVQNNSTFLECLPHSPQTTIRWLVQRSNMAVLEEIESTGRFSVLEQGLLISQLTQEDAGMYQCQGVEHSFSQTLTYYSLRIIRHRAMEALTSRRSKSTEEAEGQRSPVPASEVQPHYKGYSWGLGAPGTNLDEFCNALQRRKRRRQKGWAPKWQQHPLESKGGRVRRQPGPRNGVMLA